MAIRCIIYYYFDFESEFMQTERNYEGSGIKHVVIVLGRFGHAWLNLSLTRLNIA